jgi:hypothetical protein
MDPIGGQRRVVQQSLAKVSEVSIRMPRGSNSFIHLNHMDAPPGDIFNRKGAKHEPWSMAAAEGHDEPATGAYGSPSLCRNDRRCLSSNRIGIVEYIDDHEFSGPRGLLELDAPRFESKRRAKDWRARNSAPLRPKLHRGTDSGLPCAPAK